MSFRKTWDKDYYEAKAKARLEEESVGGTGGNSDKKDASLAKSSKEEFKPAESDAIGPEGSKRAFLKAREHKVDLTSKVGKTELFTPAAPEVARRGNQGPGFHCEVCDCILKDSAAYLDHINGKKHLRALGYSQRVERAGISQVTDRITSIKRKMEEAKGPKASAIEEYDSKVARQLVEEEARKKQKKEAEKLKKQTLKAAEEDNVDPEIAAMLGFGGFGSSKK